MRRMFSEKQIGEVAVEQLQDKDLKVKSLEADSVLEINKGFSFVPNESISSYVDLTLNYVGVVKTGNKLTFSLAGLVNFTSSGISSGGISVGSFKIPSELGQKLQGVNIGNIPNLLSLNTALMYSEDSAIVNGRGRFTKESNTSITVLLYSTGCTAGKNYSFRFEATFLLSESLVSE